MKKAVFALAGILVLGVALTPKFIGQHVKQQLTTFTEQINKNPLYQAEIKTLEQSWFNTDAVIELTIDFSSVKELAENTDTTSFTMAINYHAEHGPILLEENEIGLVAWQANVPSEFLSEKLGLAKTTPLYQLDVMVNLFGDYVYQDTIPAFNVDLKEQNGKVTFSGYHGNGVYSGNQLTYESNSNNLIFNTENNKLSFENLTVSMLANASIEQMFNSALYNSNSKFNVGKIKFIDTNAEQNIEVTDVYITAISDIDKEKSHTDLAISYGVKAINSAAFNAQDLALEIELNNLSNQFIMAYQKMAQTFTLTKPEEMKEFFEQNFLAFFANNPEFNIKSLRATLGQGKFSSNINSSLVNITNLPAPMEDPAFWLSHLLVDGNITGDKAVVEYLAKKVIVSRLKNDPRAADMSEQELENLASQQITMMIEPIVQQGFIVSTDTSYKVDFAFKDKALTVNGKAIPLPI